MLSGTAPISGLCSNVSRALISDLENSEASEMTVQDRVRR